MKKLIFISIIVTVGLSKTIIYKKEDLLDKYFEGKIRDITKYSKESNINLRVKKYGTVTIRIKNKQLKHLREGKTINLICRDKKFNKLTKCKIY